MAKQAINRDSTIKLPDGQCNKSGRESLKDLFRVHFCESDKSMQPLYQTRVIIMQKIRYTLKQESDYDLYGICLIYVIGLNSSHIFQAFLFSHVPI
jgi:hypothetical protein